MDNDHRLEWVAAQIAARLRAERARLDLTQEQAGNRAGVSWITIHRAEQGKVLPSLETLYRLAWAYGVDVTALLPTDPPPPGAAPKRRGTK